MAGKLIEHSHHYQILVGVGGTLQDYGWEYPLIYDKDEWMLDTVGLGQTLTQTYTPVTGVVRVNCGVDVQSYTPDGSFRAFNGGAEWGLLDAANQKQWNEVRAALTAEVLPERASIKANTTYQIPAVALTPHVLDVNQHVVAVLEPRVTAPASVPRFGAPIPYGGSTKLDLVTIAIFGVLIVGGLFATGYLAEKVGGLTRKEPAAPPPA